MERRTQIPKNGTPKTHCEISIDFAGQLRHEHARDAMLLRHFPATPTGIARIPFDISMLGHQPQRSKFEEVSWERINGTRLEANVVEGRGEYDNIDKITKKNGGRIPSLRELISIVKSNPDVLKVIESERIYVNDDPGSLDSGHYLINYGKGTLEHISAEEWNTLRFREKAIFRSGTLPLLVDIGEKRFLNDDFLYINGSHKMEHGATAVLIVRPCKRAPPDTPVTAQGGGPNTGQKGEDGNVVPLKQPRRETTEGLIRLAEEAANGGQTNYK